MWLECVWHVNILHVGFEAILVSDVIKKEMFFYVRRGADVLFDSLIHKDKRLFGFCSSGTPCPTSTLTTDSKAQTSSKQPAAGDSFNFCILLTGSQYFPVPGSIHRAAQFTDRRATSRLLGC